MRIGRQGRSTNDTGKEGKKNGVLSIAGSVEMVDMACTSSIFDKQIEGAMYMAFVMYIATNCLLSQHTMKRFARFIKSTHLSQI